MAEYDILNTEKQIAIIYILEKKFKFLFRVISYLFYLFRSLCVLCDKNVLYLHLKERKNTKDNYL